MKKTIDAAIFLNNYLESTFSYSASCEQSFTFSSSDRKLENQFTVIFDGGVGIDLSIQHLSYQLRFV
jgi:hypothetical protein